MTNTAPRDEEIVFPDPSEPPFAIERADISFAKVMSVSGAVFLRVYLTSGPSHDVPATERNINYLTGIGCKVDTKELGERGSQVDSGAEPETEPEGDIPLAFEGDVPKAEGSDTTPLSSAIGSAAGTR